MVWKMQVNIALQRASQLETNLQSAYALIKGQCSKPILEKVEAQLYGTLSAAMLFWKDLSGHLASEGFTANPYDSCVMNKTVNDKQCTVLWHVDDLKISHVDGNVNEDVLAGLNRRYGKVFY